MAEGEHAAVAQSAVWHLVDGQRDTDEAVRQAAAEALQTIEPDLEVVLARAQQPPASPQDTTEHAMPQGTPWVRRPADSRCRRRNTQSGGGLSTPASATQAGTTEAPRGADPTEKAPHRSAAPLPNPPLPPRPPAAKNAGLHLDLGCRLW